MDEHFVEPEGIEASISDCDRILQSEPDNYKVWHIRGHLLAHIERYEESIASYDKALKIKVDDCHSWFERGYVLSDMKEKGDDPDFMYLATWSGEVKTIQQMLDGGSRLEDCEVGSMGYSACKLIQGVPLKSDRPLSQEVISQDNCQPPKSAEKPWWKLW